MSASRGKIRQTVNSLYQVTLPIYNETNHFTGNGVAIATDLVLTSGHCVEGEYAHVFRPDTRDISKAEVIFDGSNGELSDLDFKILHVAHANFKFIYLDIEPGFGKSIQMYFKEEKGRLNPYVKSFESMGGSNATRSDQSSSSTNRGESGAPRMSLYNSRVHAIHQGESEGLKVIDIYLALDWVSKNKQSSQQGVAQEILRRVTFANRDMIGIYTSTIVLERGKVEEEKTGVNDPVLCTVNRDNEEISGLFNYREITKSGPGPRCITIHRDGVRNSQVTYRISPNPHGSRSYNKNQGEFYKSLAKSIGEYYLLNNGTYPNNHSVFTLGVNYTLTFL
ncbi:serine protease [Candidatus Protochlamydia amoebophila]|uniref:serine protease n=1 Tax=Candidatus Protochlamydia amoebophila TaxID=362787 RepID=UPI0012BA85CE|nr:serine protease [Candidatus Protochlamydia amoebophila]